MTDETAREPDSVFHEDHLDDLGAATEDADADPPEEDDPQEGGPSSGTSGEWRDSPQPHRQA